MNRCVVMIVVLLTTATLWAAENREAEFMQRGNEYYAAGKYQKAARAFEDAARLNPRNTEALHRTGMSYLRLGEGDGAVNQELVQQASTAFRKALAINPDLAETRYNLGIACLGMDDKMEATRQRDMLANLDRNLAQSLSASISKHQAVKRYKGGEISHNQRQPAHGRQRNAGPATAAAAPQRFTGTVEVYGADWCPHCREATRYMTQKGISFVYHNIEADAAAREAFAALGGGGIPLILVGNKKMRGFSRESLEFYLNNSR